MMRNIPIVSLTVKKGNALYCVGKRFPCCKGMFWSGKRSLAMSNEIPDDTNPLKWVTPAKDIAV